MEPAFFLLCALHPVQNRVNFPQLAITKTSGKLGRNQYRIGTWDRLEGQDKCQAKIANEETLFFSGLELFFLSVLFTKLP